YALATNRAWAQLARAICTGYKPRLGTTRQSDMHWLQTALRHNSPERYALATNRAWAQLARAICTGYKPRLGTTRQSDMHWLSAVYV
ncbi:MAG: hypothetical protein IJT83_09295, partial [Victivallales bacterium]|nr:hypothetical protein [Victivallales bacterium]